jgi:sporulation protein YlmC with PRC-barrel domain
MRSRGRIRQEMAIVGVVTIVLGLTAFEPGPVFPQGVELLRVDVSVVAKGYRASKLLGSSVVNDKNEKIGSLDDIIIDRNQVMFAVLQVGGFLGLGGRLVAVPYKTLVIDDEGKKIELPGATKEALRGLAEFKYAT